MLRLLMYSQVVGFQGDPFLDPTLFGATVEHPWIAQEFNLAKASAQQANGNG